MRYTAEHKAHTRHRIVQQAARQIRAKGLQGPAVADVMKAVGLTHGGFYKHFHDKTDLVIEAIESSLSSLREQFLPAAKAAPAGEGWKHIVRWYLAPEHCEHSDTGCPMVALAPDIARSPLPLKRRIAAMLKRHRDEILPLMPGRTPAEREKNHLLIITAMAGAVLVARMFPEAADRERILSIVREHLLASF